MATSSTHIYTRWLQSTVLAIQPILRSLHPQPYLPLPLKQHILIATFAGLMGIFFGALRIIFQVPGNDLWLAYGSAQLLWQGENPYSYATGGWPSNPLTTVLVIAPFIHYSLPLIGAGIVALSTALLIYASFRSGQLLRLWALASWPFWYNILFAQWGILFLAILLLPNLTWLSLVKPQLGISVFFSRFQWKQVVYAVLFLLLSFLVSPSWPLHWLEQVHGYDGFIPLLYFPIGLLVFLVVAKKGFSSHRVVFYTLFCLSPQRLWHDQLLLWYIPRRPWQIALITLTSWLSAFTMYGSLSHWVWLVLLCQFLPCGLYLLSDSTACD